MAEQIYTKLVDNYLVQSGTSYRVSEVVMDNRFTFITVINMYCQKNYLGYNQCIIFEQKFCSSLFPET